MTPRTFIEDYLGPRPPFDAECAIVLDGIPPFPALSMESIPSLRVPPPGFEPPTNEQLARSGSFSIEERSVPGPQGSPHIPILICRPTNSEEPRPAIFYIHGGGMISGEKRMGLPQILEWAEVLSLAVVSIDYRVAPETPYPGPVEDCYAAWKWAADNFDEIGMTEGCVLVGESAGGGLAGALTLLARDRGGPQPLGVMLFAPMLDDRNDSPSAVQMMGVDTWDRSCNEIGWTALLGSARGGPDVPEYAAPARATDLTNLPAMFLDVGSAETFRDEVVDFAARLWRAGGQAELHVWPGGFHGYNAIAPDAAISRETSLARARWLTRIIGLLE